jgi:hypothetical protein
LFYPVKDSGYNANSTALNNFTRDITLPIDKYCIGTSEQTDYHNGLGGIDSTIQENVVTCGFVTPSQGIRLTEKLLVKVDHRCYTHPVYIGWWSKPAGWAFWLFHFTQTIKRETDDLGIFKPNYWDLENQRGSYVDLGKIENETMIVGAEGLSIDDFKGILTLASAHKVTIFPPLSDTVTKQIDVIVNKGSFPRDTKNFRGFIEFEILMPEINTIKN